MAEIDDRWLSVDEICKHLGVSNDTVYKWIDRHEMSAHRMGVCGNSRKMKWMNGFERVEQVRRKAGQLRNEKLQKEMQVFWASDLCFEVWLVGKGV